MNNEVYEKVAESFSRIYAVRPLVWDREGFVAFRAAWLAYLDTAGVTLDEWFVELIRRARDKGKSQGKL